MPEKPEQRTADALFLLDALQHVTSTVVINAAEIASRKDAKVNTIQKRFTTIKQRYNLNIQTTAAGNNVSAAPGRVTKPKNTTRGNRKGTGLINKAEKSYIQAIFDRDQDSKTNRDKNSMAKAAADVTIKDNPRDIDDSEAVDDSRGLDLAHKAMMDEHVDIEGETI